MSMEFTVEFYETVAGQCPVRDFLDALKADDPNDFAAVVAGLAKLKNRQYHREPLSKSIGDGLYELRHVGKLNSRVLWFSWLAGASSLCMASETKAARFLLMIWIRLETGCMTGRRG